MNRHAASLMMAGTAFPALVVNLSTTSVTGSSTGSSVTSNTVTANTTGGSGGTKTYVWSRISGNSSISPNSPNSASTSFSASIGSYTSISAAFQCTVTDTVSGEVKTSTNTVTANLTRSMPALGISTSGSGSRTVISSTEVVVTSPGVTLIGSGGTGSYSYSHSQLSGDFSISGGNPCTHSRSLQPQGGVSGTVRGTVSDGNSSTSTDYGVVLINNGTAPPTLSASASPSHLNALAFSSTPGSYYVTLTTSGSTSVSVSGGSGSYTYAWSGGVVANSPNSSSTSLTHTFLSFTSVEASMSCAIRDTVSGATASAGVSATFTHLSSI